MSIPSRPMNPAYGPGYGYGYAPGYGYTPGYAQPPAPPRASGPPGTVLLAFWAVLGQIAVYGYRTWLAVHDPAVATGTAQVGGVTFTGDSSQTLVALLWGAAGLGALLLFALASRMKNGGRVARFLLAAVGVLTVLSTAGHLAGGAGTAHLLDLATVGLAGLTAVAAYGPGSARWFRR